ncbi:MAG: NUDIX hydrolase [Flavobacterium sp.]|nr:NUDIX hydrolase [Candidatus Neoflavobacterium equi]
MRVSKIFVTVDVVLTREVDGKLELLLIKRDREPFAETWALPGGFVDENEDLETAAKRELLEETQIAVDALQQVGAFGTPFRDPRSHVISVAFYGKVASDVFFQAGDDANDAGWYGLDKLPELAFDHCEIIKKAQQMYM